MSNYNFIAVIPARKGSKRLKNKNILLLNSQPLISYTIASAKKSKYISDIIVSTDSIEILNIAKEYGINENSLRDEKYASSTSKTIDTILYEIDKRGLKNKKNVIVLLQPTSPFRTEKDIDNAIETFLEKKSSVVSVVKVDQHPNFMRKVDETGKLNFFMDNIEDHARTQDLEEVYVCNGAIYINEVDLLTDSTDFNKNDYAYIMDAPSSIDIDNYSDFQFAEFMLMQKNNLETEDV
ncbi:CMP-N,N'-diacetyllegionaminic acid synthase [Bacilli bacterium PM5-9]|nr:CMP-N,N'-diacetyllegionaminic acid synthase [Bacilli bacterium PM5-9]